MITFEDLRRSEAVATYIQKADDSLSALGYTEHSFSHVTKAASMAGSILETLGYPKREAELARIAGYLHDIGNIVNRVDHAQSGAVMAFRILDKMGMDPGEIADVTGTPFDFRQPHAIGERIGADNEQLRNGAGYDHNWVLDRKTADGIEPAATVWEPASGRTIEVLTDQPAMQFYSGNFFDGKANGKYGKPLRYRESLALETQKYPDSPNHDNFPSTVLRPGEEYTQVCIYRFGVK